ETSQRVQGFDFLSNGIWAEIVSLTETVIPRIFLPAIPDAFYFVSILTIIIIIIIITNYHYYWNYTTTFKFISDLDQFASNKQQLDAFRNNPAYIKYKKKWDLNSNSYFQLRYEN